MSITVAEKYNGRQFSRTLETSDATVEYIIQGTDDESAAMAALVDTAPAYWNEMPKTSLFVKQMANTLWEGSCVYGYKAPVDGSNYSFETGGGTQHITQSLATIQKYAPSGKTAPDFKGAICVDKDSVNGCDIVVPVYTWTDVYIKKNIYITDNYKAILCDLTGKVNNATFKGRAAGEVLFMGAAGSKQGYSGDWEISYKFAASPNVTGKTVGEITGIAKKGWEFLWIRYEDADDTNAKVLIKKPSSVYIERVYETGSFSGLGI